MSKEQKVWDHRYLELAKLASTWSEDTSRGVGAVIVGPANDIRSVGYNTMPRKIDSSIDSRHSRENGEKYYWFEHAERNAIYNAVRSGMMTYDCTMYSSVFPCASCMRAIVQSGIKALKTVQPDLNDAKFGRSFEVSLEMAKEAGLDISFIVDESTD